MFSLWNHPPSGLALIAAAIFVDMLMYGAMIPLLPELMQRFGMSGAMAGLFLGVYPLIMMSLSLAFGRLADRHPRHRLVGYALLMAALGCLMIAQASSLPMLFMGRVFQSLSATLLWTSTLAMVARQFMEGRRTQALAICSSASMAGLLVGPVISGWIAERIGYPLTFHGLAALYAALALAALVALREPQRPDRTSTTRFSVLSFLRLSAVVPVILLLASGMVLLGLFEILLPRYLVSAFRVTPFQLGIVLSVFTLSYSLSSLLAARYWDRQRSRPVTAALRWGLIVTAALLLVTGLPGSVLGFALAIGLTGISMGYWMSPLMDMMSRAMEHSTASLAHGAIGALYNLISSAGLAMGATGGGLAGDYLSLQIVLAAIALVAILQAITLPAGIGSVDAQASEQESAQKSA